MITRFGSDIKTTFQHESSRLPQPKSLQEIISFRVVFGFCEGQEKEKLEKQHEKQPKQPLKPDNSVRAGLDHGDQVLLVHALQSLENEAGQHQHDGQVDVAFVESAVVQVAGDDDEDDAHQSRGHPDERVSLVIESRYLYIFFFKKYREMMGMNNTIDAWSIWKKLIGMKVKQISWRVLAIVPSKLAIESRKELNRNICGYFGPPFHASWPGFCT